MEDILKEKIEFVSINPNSVLYLPKMVSRRWAAPKNPVARMRNLARGVITLFRQNIVTLAKIMKDQVCETISTLERPTASCPT